MGSFFLRREFTWPQPMSATIAKTTPTVPPIPGRTTRRVCGVIHSALKHLSQWYRDWLGIVDPFIMHLPFGLVLKWTDRTSLEEVAAMKMARAAGMPVPKVLSCGEHPHSAPFLYSILMTRLPGMELMNMDEPLQVESEEPWLFELKECMDAMRQWTPPDPQRISSVLGTSIRSTRVPFHIMGPFANESELIHSSNRALILFLFSACLYLLLPQKLPGLRFMQSTTGVIKVIVFHRPI